MKKSIIIGLTVVTAAAFTSCDDFLNDNRFPLSQQTVNSEYWSNPENVQAQVNYFYQDFSGYGNGSGGGSFYFKFLNDDQAGRTGFENWAFINVPGSSSSYTAPYVEIRRANLIIEGVTASTLNDASKADYIAQARLHRARNFYELVRRYGDVPLVTKALDPKDDAELFGPRTPRNEVMDYVLADLDDAVANITKQSAKTEFSRDLANAVKAEICLYEGAYQRYTAKNEERAKKFYGEAAKAAEAVAPKYPIGADYLSLYKSLNNDLNGNAEIIFYKPYQQGVFMNSIIDFSSASDGIAGLTKDAFDSFLFRDGLPASKTSFNRTDVGTPEVSATGVKSYNIQPLLDVRDARLEMTTYPCAFYPGLTYSGPNTMAMYSITGYGVSKYNNFSIPTNDATTANKGYVSAPLFWGARVSLALIEAKAELGTLNNADLAKYMQPMWNRAKINATATVAFLSGINDPDNDMNVSSLIWEVRRCRRCETMMDDNIRYWDLVRWHQLDKLDMNKNPDIALGANISKAPVAPSAVKGDYLDCSYGMTRVFNEKYYLYPLPSDQLSLNTALTQNPGW